MDSAAHRPFQRLSGCLTPHVQTWLAPFLVVPVGMCLDELRPTHPDIRRPFPAQRPPITRDSDDARPRPFHPPTVEIPFRVAQSEIKSFLAHFFFRQPAA